MEPSTLATQEAAARVLYTLCRTFPHLPDAHHSVQPVADADWAEGLVVRVYNDPPAFEAWRDALDLDPGQLKPRTLPDYLTLSGVVHHFGAPVELVGFLPLPTEQPDPSADAP